MDGQDNLESKKKDLDWIEKSVLTIVSFFRRWVESWIDLWWLITNPRKLLDNPEITEPDSHSPILLFLLCWMSASVLFAASIVYLRQAGHAPPASAHPTTGAEENFLSSLEDLFGPEHIIYVLIPFVALAAAAGNIGFRIARFFPSLHVPEGKARAATIYAIGGSVVAWSIFNFCYDIKDNPGVLLAAFGTALNKIANAWDEVGFGKWLLHNPGPLIIAVFVARISWVTCRESTRGQRLTISALTGVAAFSILEIIWNLVLGHFNCLANLTNC